MSSFLIDGLAPMSVIEDWAARAVHHMSIASEKSRKWEECKRALQEEPAYQNATPAERRRFREINWGMKDALAGYNWHINEANRLNQAIIAQHAFRQMRTQS